MLRKVGGIILYSLISSKNQIILANTGTIVSTIMIGVGLFRLKLKKMSFWNSCRRSMSSIRMKKKRIKLRLRSMFVLTMSIKLIKINMNNKTKQGTV